MSDDDNRADKPTDSERRTGDGPSTEPLIRVDVSRETARAAARIADEHGIAVEDALARLTAYDYPVDAVTDPAGTSCGCEGP